MPGGTGICRLDAGQRVRRCRHGIEYFRQGKQRAPAEHSATKHASTSNPTPAHTYATRTAFGDTPDCKFPRRDDGREQLPNHYIAEPGDGQRDNLQRKCCGSRIWDFGSRSPDEHCSGAKHHI